MILVTTASVSLLEVTVMKLQRLFWLLLPPGLKWREAADNWGNVIRNSSALVVNEPFDKAEGILSAVCTNHNNNDNKKGKGEDLD